MRRRSNASSVFFAAALVVAALAACGGQAPAPQTPASPAASGTIAGEPGRTATSVPATAPGGTSSATTPAGLPPPAVDMKPLVASAMLEDLRGLGLDPKNLPPIEKLEPRTLRGVMKLMAKSLGVKCGACHQEGDFAAPTPKKKVAAHMWDEFAAKLAFDDGAPLFCDSCHEGRTLLLDRRDKKALSKWMDETFVARLGQKDAKTTPGGPVECETCHVDMDMHFLVRWSQ